MTATATATVEPAPKDDIASLNRLREAYETLRNEVGRVVIGQQQVVEELLIAMFSRGHCILEGVPGLAKTWDVSADGITYTFHLRNGVKFHDGRPFSAKNVVASFQRVLDPKTKGGRGWPLYPIKGAEDYAAGKAQAITGMAAPDDSTLVHHTPVAHTCNDQRKQTILIAERAIAPAAS